MKTQDAINYYGSAAELARKLKMTGAGVSFWGGTVPKGRAAELHVLTDGKLVYDPEDYDDTKTDAQTVPPDAHNGP